MSEIQCTHVEKVTYRNKRFCRQCGLYLIHSQIFKNVKYRIDYDPFLYFEKCLKSWNYKESFEGRSEILKKMKQLIIKMDLSFNTLFLAMHYLDTLNLDDQDYRLYSLAAIQIAGNFLGFKHFRLAKFNENNQNLPQMEKFLSKQKDLQIYTIEQVIQCEQKLLKQLDWNCMHYTLLDKVELILSFGILEENDSLLKRQEIVKDLKDDCIWELSRKIEKKSRAMCLKVLDDEIYFENDQKILAASIVAYLRRKFGIMNFWSFHLECLTNVSAQKLSLNIIKLKDLDENFDNEYRSQIQDLQRS